MTLREDSKVNRLKESLDLFRSIWINRWLSRVSVILFLNKYDILVQKITSSQCKLEEYFPEFKDYKPSSGFCRNFKVDNEDPEVTRAKLFILELFIEITNEEMNKYQTNFKKFCKPYFTCAVDSENIVFKACSNILQNWLI